MAETDDMLLAESLGQYIGFTPKPGFDKNKGPYEWKPHKWDKYLNRCAHTQGIENFPLPNIKEKGYEGFDLEIFKFIQTLIFYKTSIENKLYEAEEIFFLSFEEGPSFTNELTDLRKYSMRSTFGVTEASIFMDVPELEGSIDFIFPSTCLVNWKLPDPEDWSYYFEEPEEIDDFHLDELMSELRLLLEGYDLPQPDMLDDLSWVRSTSSLRLEDDETEPCWISQSKDKGERYTSYFSALNVVIQKNPAETRPVLIMTPPSLRTVSDCSKLLSYIGKNIKEYCVHKVDKVYNNELSKLKGVNFLMLDFSKCGIRFPRKIVISAFSLLEELYPSFECFRRAKEMFINGLQIKVGEDWKIALNGIGLGMFIELVTIIIIAIFNLSKKIGILPESAEGRFVNDDQLIWFKSDLKFDDDTLARYREFVSQYKLVVHQEKPFLANRGQFCEMWTPGVIDMEKRVEQYATLLDSIDCVNIAHAKHRHSGLHEVFWGLSAEDNYKALSVLINFWGYEFSEEEINLPYEYGGWFKYNRDGLNPALNMLPDIPKKFRNLILLKPPGLEEIAKLRTKDSLSTKNYGYVTDSLIDMDLMLARLVDMRMKHFRHLEAYYAMKAKYKIRFSLETNIYKNFMNRRKVLYDAKCLHHNDFIEEISKRDWNNYEPPDALIVQREEMKKEFLPIPKIPQSDDLFRQYLTFNHVEGVRKVLGPSGALLRLITPEEVDLNPFVYVKVLNNYKSLQHFGNPYKIAEYIIDKFGFDSNLPTELGERDLVDIEQFAVGDGDHLFVLDGILVKVNALPYSMVMESFEYVYDNIIKQLETYLSKQGLEIPWIEFAYLAHEEQRSGFSNKYLKKYFKEYIELVEPQTIKFNSSMFDKTAEEVIELGLINFLSKYNLVIHDSDIIPTVQEIPEVKEEAPAWRPRDEAIDITNYDFSNNTQFAIDNLQRTEMELDDDGIAMFDDDEDDY